MRWSASRSTRPSFDPDRFTAHESFFVGDVRRWVRSRFGVALPADRTAVCGVSASAEFSLAMRLRHPDISGVVFAGTQEPFLLQNARRWADALRDAGADVVLTQRVGNQGDPFWAAEFPLVVAWAFGR